jgi:SAM-dependent methyltransferase
MGYYSNKRDSLADIFGGDVVVEDDSIRVGEVRFPVVDDVILCLNEAQLPPWLFERVAGRQSRTTSPTTPIAADIQFTFGEEWKQFPAITADHGGLFREYFDLVNLPALADQRVCDLGCGMGRWSYFVADHCREIVLVDFSDAIFVARQNLAKKSNAIFIMADIQQLPLRDDCAGLVFSLGVLHHLPVAALDEVRKLGRLAPQLLVYLYYALDNRPAYFRLVLSLATVARRRLSQWKHPLVRRVATDAVAFGVYLPLVSVGRLFDLAGLGSYVPLFDMYKDKSIASMRQDAYDRFFTSIEQRVSRAQIAGLRDHFGSVTISDRLPFWHFLCSR